MGQTSTTGLNSGSVFSDFDRNYLGLLLPEILTGNRYFRVLCGQSPLGVSGDLLWSLSRTLD